MTIKRNDIYPGMNENAILAKYGYMDIIFYGIYQLNDPNKGVCIEGGVEVHEPLLYRFDAERCDDNGMISF